MFWIMQEKGKVLFTGSAFEFSFVMSKCVIFNTLTNAQKPLRWHCLPFVRFFFSIRYKKCSLFHFIWSNFQKIACVNFEKVTNCSVQTWNGTMVSATSDTTDAKVNKSRQAVFLERGKTTERIKKINFQTDEKSFVCFRNGQPKCLLRVSSGWYQFVSI